MFQIALSLVIVMTTACKKADKSAGTTADEVAKASDPGKPADPAKSADPAAKPADPAAKPADSAVKPADPAKPGTPAAVVPGNGNTELENKGIAMMQRMVDVFVADQNDCEKMATDIRAFTAENKELLNQLAAMEKTMTPEEKTAFEARNKPVQEALLAKMSPAVRACGENESVEAAMKELGPP